MVLVSHRGWTFTALIAAFTPVVLASLILRFVALKRQRRASRSDDWLVVVAVASILAMEGTAIWAIHNGLGRHSSELSPQELSVQFKLLWSGNITWTLATSLLKLAALRLYLSLFPGATFKRVVWVVTVATILYAGVLIPVYIFSCKPISAGWTPSMVESHCFPSRYHALACVTIGMVLDIVIVAVPLPIVWNIHMPTRKKVAVSAMFSLGLLIVAVMTWRLIITANPNPNPDFAYNLYITAVLCHLEVWLGLLATNFPGIAPLLKGLVPQGLRKYISGNRSKKASTPRLALKTFGSSGVNSRRNEFTLLSDVGTGAENSSWEIPPKAISVERQFRVSIDQVRLDVPKVDSSRFV
ncbi:hypothetical protein BDV95DRAFT_575153 [Massariosphaeria phaeospora]|uniref:Rhodopsin domain-containing protein n=1 Tax=Massariosphaeria phaeospora TaxID=100035 RepID=A0A7C8M4K3_9PLEO|nr:hypothetical protein BDV95DRAFT_575153 [Massariosphaeria phaeospora]